MVVDDEPANVRLLERMLESWGCPTVYSTTNPREAVPFYLEFQPDLIILDLAMPGLDGFGVMQLLRPLIPAGTYMPVLILTADTTQPTKLRALSVGAKDFLTKPFDEVELSLRVTNLVESRFLHLKMANQNRTLDEKVRERTRALQQSVIETAECLAIAGEFRDDDTGTHTQRVGQTAVQLAQALGIAAPLVELIGRAAPLHDIGKIGIPDAILLKPSKLTPEEFERMKEHTSIGARILARHHTTLLRLASNIAMTHHEHWDGGGYPKGLVGRDIPIEGLIVAVADVFDALTHRRPYKEAWSFERAVAEIKNQSGRMFSPAVVEAFCKVQASGG